MYFEFRNFGGAMFFKNTAHDVKFNVYNGIFLAIATNLVNPYYAKFAQRLGASDYHLAFLNSGPAFVSIFALIPGALIIEALGRKQHTTSIFMLIHKLFFLMLAIVPWLSGVSKPGVFVALVALMNFPGAIYSTGYQSSVGDLFPAKERYDAMSLRNRYADLFRLIITFLSGFALTTVSQNNGHTLIMYQVFFVIAFIFGCFEVYTYYAFENLSKHSSGKRITITAFYHTLKSGVAYVIQNSEFKLFFICSLIFHFGWQMGWPLFNIYMLQTLSASEGWLSAVSIASALSSILTVTYWGKFAQKHGNTIAIIIATFGMSITPFLYVVSESLAMLVVFNVLIGISITGTTLVLFNMLLDVTPSSNRTTIISIYNTLIAVSATIAPIIGVAIKDAKGLSFALITVGLLRLLGCLSFLIRKKIRNRMALN